MTECELEIQERSKYIEYIRGNCISVFLSLNHPNSDHNSAYYTDNIFIYKLTYPLAVLQALPEQTSIRLARSKPQSLQSTSHYPMPVRTLAVSEDPAFLARNHETLWLPHVNDFLQRPLPTNTRY